MVLKLMPFNIEVCGLSDIGLVRDNNEDLWAEMPQINTYALADGMGGHRAGEVASYQAITVFQQLMGKIFFNRNTQLSLGESRFEIEHVLTLVNTHVYQMGCRDPELRGMGTTFCCLFFHEQGLVYGHIGDSRIYRLRDSKLEQMTKDHSLLRQMVDLGQLDEKGEKEFLYKNIITKAIGTEAYVEPSVYVGDLLVGDIYLMCTDGLSDLVPFEEIERVLSEGTPEEQASELVKIAKEKGGHDNITVVAIKVREGAHGEKNLSG